MTAWGTWFSMSVIVKSIKIICIIALVKKNWRFKILFRNIIFVGDFVANRSLYSVSFVL